TSAAGIGAVCAAVDLAKRLGHIREWVASASNRLTLEFASAGDHLFQHRQEIWLVQFQSSRRCAQHRGKADAVKPHRNEFSEHFLQLNVERRHSRTGRNLHALLSVEQGLHSGHDPGIAAVSSPERPQTVMGLTDAVKAYRYREAVFLKKARVL